LQTTVICTQLIEEVNQDNKVTVKIWLWVIWSTGLCTRLLQF